MEEILCVLTKRTNRIINFKTVKIFSQEWMAENLNVDIYRNGDTILYADTPERWDRFGASGKGCWCYYDNAVSNGKKYGRLYNWYSVNDPRGLAPEGWHVPSDDEWTRLVDNLGGEGDAGKKLKSTLGWNENGNGSNKSGFAALPGSYCDHGACGSTGTNGNWWSSSENSKAGALFMSMNYNDNYVYRHSYDKRDGYSVRCLHN